MEMTKHATSRSQQRNIPSLAIRWIREFGRKQHDHRGCVIRFLDKDARKKLEKSMGHQIVKKLNEYLNCYIVEDCVSGSVITVGHHYKRLHAA
jgi:hypothetical protein